MPKMKTKKSMAKRVRITGSGKIKRMRTFAGCHHIRENKSPKRVRTFRQTAICDPVDEKMVKRLVPYIK